MKIIQQEETISRLEYCESASGGRHVFERHENAKAASPLRESRLPSRTSRKQSSGPRQEPNSPQKDLGT